MEKVTLPDTAAMAGGERHQYEYLVDTESRTAGAFVVEFVGMGRRVLEVGCGPGSITRVLATSRHCQVTGVEIDPAAIEKVASFCEAVIRADLNSPDWPKLVADRLPFDAVVAADVLEHLYDPWEALGQMAGLVCPDGFLVVSLPHICHAAVASCLMDGNFQYRDWGLLDRTHIRFFGLKNMQELVTRAGLKIVGYRYVIKPPEETEFASSWVRLPMSLRRVLASAPHSHIYQVVIKAVPVGRPGAALTLAPPPRNLVKSTANWKSRLRNVIARRLGPRAKQVIRTQLRKFGIDP